MGRNPGSGGAWRKGVAPDPKLQRKAPKPADSAGQSPAAPSGRSKAAPCGGAKLPLTDTSSRPPEVGRELAPVPAVAAPGLGAPGLCEPWLPGWGGVRSQASPITSPATHRSPKGERTPPLNLPQNRSIIL
jgi:hypothetical protein